jgi:hypothetical protein
VNVIGRLLITQIHTFGTKSILVIREVFIEDSGVFAVIAENPGGTAKCSANLVVEERKQRMSAAPPSFTSTIQDTTVQAGQLARFDARVSGTQPMDIYWLKVTQLSRRNELSTFHSGSFPRVKTNI